MQILKHTPTDTALPGIMFFDPQLFLDAYVPVDDHKDFAILDLDNHHLRQLFVGRPVWDNLDGVPYKVYNLRLWALTLVPLWSGVLLKTVAMSLPHRSYTNDEPSVILYFAEGGRPLIVVDADAANKPVNYYVGGQVLWVSQYYVGLYMGDGADELQGHTYYY